MARQVNVVNARSPTCHTGQDESVNRVSGVNVPFLKRPYICRLPLFILRISLEHSSSALLFSRHHLPPRSLWPFLGTVAALENQFHVLSICSIMCLPPPWHGGIITIKSDGSHHLPSLRGPSTVPYGLGWWRHLSRRCDNEEPRHGGYVTRAPLSWHSSSSTATTMHTGLARLAVQICSTHAKTRAKDHPSSARRNYHH